jgi:hypothetical protein
MAFHSSRNTHQRCGGEPGNAEQSHRFEWTDSRIQERRLQL